MVLIYSAPIERWECMYEECGARCCTGGREVTAGDIRRISKVTNLSPEEFVHLEDEKGLFRLKGDEKCVFLNEDFSCQLHDKGVKPLFCQMYPFKFDGVIYADEIVLKIRVTENCPGIGRGPKIGEDLESSIEELGNKFVNEIKDFLRLKGEGLSNESIFRRD
jgi:Fe-S-cluster containining protein